MSLLTNLILYWKFDESSGNAVDSVSSVVGTNNNTCTYSAGVIGNAINMNSGSSQYLNHVDAAVFDFNSDFTISFWAKVTAGTSGARPVIAKRNATNANYQYYVGYNPTDGNWILSFAPSGYTGANYYFGARIDKVTTGTFFYITMTCTLANSNSTKSELFVNGVSQGNLLLLDGSGATSINTSSTPADFLIGFDVSSSTYWNGSLDELGLWTRVLSGAEITSLYNSGSGLTYPFGIVTANSGFFDFF